MHLYLCLPLELWNYKTVDYNLIVNNVSSTAFSTALFYKWHVWFSFNPKTTCLIFSVSASMTSICLDSILKQKSSSLSHSGWLNCRIDGQLDLKTNLYPASYTLTWLPVKMKLCNPQDNLHGHVSHHRPISSHIIPWGWLARSWQKLCSSSLRVLGYIHTAVVETIPFIIFTPSFVTKTAVFKSVGKKILQKMVWIYLNRIIWRILQ